MTAHHSASNYESWGHYPKATHRAVVTPSFRSVSITLDKGLSWLPRGNGRSYGDVCLNPDNGLISSSGLQRLISFDPESGILHAESGVLLSEIIDLVVPVGWFLPVTPGTMFVTLGGAIANDVHGKNHHTHGTFGKWVRSIDIVRADSGTVVCSLSQNEGLFRATIGGLGLTGFIVAAEIQLERIESPFMLVREKPFQGIDEFWDLDEAMRKDYPYTVAWIDCLDKNGRGIYTAARSCHSPGVGSMLNAGAPKSINFPVAPPFSLVNGWSLRLFNKAYYATHSRKQGECMTSLMKYHYPLDGIKNWNRMYGPKGFLQYQCVVPSKDSRFAISELLRKIRQSGQGSFLAVLKTFGDEISTGMLSFPMPGATLALDFPFKGASTTRLLDNLDAIVSAVGGRIYPAKDARMSAGTFLATYPQMTDFTKYIEPGFSSGFWRRVSQ